MVQMVVWPWDQHLMRDWGVVRLAAARFSLVVVGWCYWTWCRRVRHGVSVASPERACGPFLDKQIDLTDLCGGVSGQTRTHGVLSDANVRPFFSDFADAISLHPFSTLIRNGSNLRTGNVLSR